MKISPLRLPVETSNVTKHIHITARGLQRILLEAPWPIPVPTPTAIQIAADGWRALCAWHLAGEHVYRVRGDESPVVDGDSRLASQRLRRDGQAYILDDVTWIVLGRVQARTPTPLGASTDRSISQSHPMLYWCAEVGGGIESGAANLDDQPTIRDLRIVAGKIAGQCGTRTRDGSDLSGPGIVLARVLPLFLDSTTRS